MSIILYLVKYGGTALLGMDSEYSADYMDYLVYYLGIGGKQYVPGIIMFFGALILLIVLLTEFRIHNEVFQK